jgi:hypothetical protein
MRDAGFGRATCVGKMEYQMQDRWRGALGRATCVGMRTSVPREAAAATGVPTRPISTPSFRVRCSWAAADAGSTGAHRARQRKAAARGSGHGLPGSRLSGP